ncbi:glycosyltransferase [Paenibacillus larvae]|nr:glycosyltransferase [Paenibacillus larvae]MDT2263996.1 glycosyltransferase [Paenibacillus larvae]
MIIQNFLPTIILSSMTAQKDRTPQILNERQFNCLHLPVNMGIGASMQTGYKYAYRHRYDYAIQLDADGQHDPKGSG